MEEGSVIFNACQKEIDERVNKRTTEEYRMPALKGDMDAGCRGYQTPPIDFFETRCHLLIGGRGAL
jgi:hypothetical protein